ncbi:unnamed protein product [Calypogeia fissa]
MAHEKCKLDRVDKEPQTHKDPVLCINSCGGFFGNAETMNLCSKCYRDLVLKQAKQHSAKLAEVEKPSDVAESSNLLHSSSSSSTGLKEPSQELNRCFSCNRKIGLIAIKCRCGNAYCALHRHAEKHNCLYDYKSAARDAIAKANPVIKADKVQKDL